MGGKGGGCAVPGRNKTDAVCADTDTPQVEFVMLHPLGGQELGRRTGHIGIVPVEPEAYGILARPQGGMVRNADVAGAVEGECLVGIAGSSGGVGCGSGESAIVAVDRVGGIAVAGPP